MAKTWTQERLAELHDLKSEGLSYRAIAEVMDSTYDSVRNAYRRNLKQPNDVVTEAGLDPKKFQAKTINVNGSWFQLKEDELDIDELTTQLAEKIDYTKPIDEVKTHTTEALLPVADMHIGFTQSAEAYLNALPSFNGKVHIAIMGDFLHYEAHGKTSSGTKIVNQVNITDMVSQGVSFILKLIEKYPNNELHFVAGNHDETISAVVFETLAKLGVVEHQDWFALTKGIVIKDNPIVLYHGSSLNKDKIKQQNFLKYTNEIYPELSRLALDTGKLVRWEVGHIHTMMSRDDLGVHIDQVPVVPENSDYEVRNSFVGSKHAPVFDIFGEQGLTQRIYIHLTK